MSEKSSPAPGQGRVKGGLTDQKNICNNKCDVALLKPSLVKTGDRQKISLKNRIIAKCGTSQSEQVLLSLGKPSDVLPMLGWLRSGPYPKLKSTVLNGVRFYEVV